MHCSMLYNAAIWGLLKPLCIQLHKRFWKCWYKIYIRACLPSLQTKSVTPEHFHNPRYYTAVRVAVSVSIFKNSLVNI